MKTGSSEILSDINITPLTDIFLVLLIIMMVVAPLLEYKGLSAALVAPGPSQASDDDKTLIVKVAADGALTLGPDSVASDQLVTALREQAPAHDNAILIDIHPDATLQHLATVMDAAQVAGIAKVSISQEEAAPLDVSTTTVTTPK